MKKLVFVFLSLSLILSSCCDEPVEAARHNLTNVEKTLIPYQLNQIIHFTKPNGELFDFEVVKDEVNLREEHPFCEWTCCKDFVTYEDRKVELAAEDSSFNKIAFYVFASETSEFVKNLDVSFSRFHGVALPYDSLGTFVCDSTILCYDSLLINGKYYYDVKQKSCFRWEQDTSTVWPDSLIYNDLGILQIQMSNDDKYSISE